MPFLYCYVLLPQLTKSYEGFLIDQQEMLPLIKI